LKCCLIASAMTIKSFLLMMSTPMFTAGSQHQWRGVK
jgi:hypothetical protein